MSHKLDPQLFIERAKKVSPEYDYSNTIYSSSAKQVKVNCQLHGEFLAWPNNLIKGVKCKHCGIYLSAKTRSHSFEKFKENFEKYNEDRIDFSKSIYLGYKKKITVLCKKHNVYFSILPNHLINGIGCKNCHKRKDKDSLEIFIDKSKLIHGDRYDYSKFDYTGSHGKGIIICLKHGEFIQSATKHLSNHGCQLCGQESSIETRTKSLEQFIKDAGLIFNNRFDYSQFKYVTALTPGKVLCFIHGAFEISPNRHLTGGACPKCRFYNQTQTKEYLEQIFPSIKFIKKRISTIVIRNNKIIRKYLLPDFRFIEKGQEFIVEYNGKQHYQPVTRFGGKKRFEEQKLRDCALRNYCAEHNIKLIEIDGRKYKANKIKEFLMSIF